MSVRADGRTLRLEGDCPVEDAEAVVVALQAGGVEAVDLGGCEGLHTAVAQALLAFDVPLTGTSPDPFVRDHLTPALQAVRKVGQAPSRPIELSQPGAPKGSPPKRS